jgi:GWxTD domain-containing protein
VTVVRRDAANPLASGFFLFLWLCTGLVPAQSLPELFHKAKAQVKGESWNEALKTLALLETESAKPGHETARQQLEGPMAFYRGVCEANLGRTEEAQADFEAFLAIQPNATMDPSMYSKKAIAAFEAARRDAAPQPDSEPDGRPSIFLAYQEFKLPPNSGEQVGMHWADGPVRWIMTGDEKRRWSELVAGADWQEFVDGFWEVRNPNPGNPDNIFKTTFERRVAFADAHFVQDEETRGSLTDRGMVFVLLGPPTYAGKKPLRTGEDASDPDGMTNELAGPGLSPSASGQAPRISVFASAGGARILDAASNWREVWHYRRELLPKGVGYQQVDVEFITKRGYGENVLQRDHATLATLDAARVPKTVKKD